jgi:hypothetical protein
MNGLCLDGQLALRDASLCFLRWRREPSMTSIEKAVGSRHGARITKSFALQRQRSSLAASRGSKGASGEVVSVVETRRTNR